MNVGQRHRIVAGDCHDVLSRTQGFWTSLAGRRLLVSGASGFLGCWLLEIITMAVERYRFECDIVAFGSTSEVRLRGAEHLIHHRSVSWFDDAKTLDSAGGDFYYGVYFVPGPSADRECTDPLIFRPQSLLARRSLIVYDAVDEPDAFTLARKFSQVHASFVTGGSDEDGTSEKRATIVARVLSAFGPYLAIGSESCAAPLTRVIATKARQPMYAADVVSWLCTILFVGKAGITWDIGSNSVIDMATRSPATLNAWKRVVDWVGHEWRPTEVRSPNTEYTRDVLRLKETVRFEDGLARTVAWLSDHSEMRRIEAADDPGTGAEK